MRRCDNPFLPDHLLNTLVIPLLFFALIVLPSQKAVGYALTPIAAQHIANLPEAASSAGIGFSNGALLLAGGWNSTASQPLDQVRILPDVFTNPSNAAWIHIKEHALAQWPTTAQDGENLICIGGWRDGLAMTTVVRWTWKSGKLKLKYLPSLPAPRLFAGAAVLNHTLYLVGGLTGKFARRAARQLWSLSLEHPETGWKCDGNCPALPRLFPAVAAQNGALIVVGGQAGHPYKRCTKAWLFRPKPVDGTVAHGWQLMAAPPFKLAGPGMMPLGESHLLVFGGVASTIKPRLLNGLLPKKPEESLNKKLWTYDTVVNAWVAIGTSRPLGIEPVAASDNQTWLMVARRVTTHSGNLWALQWKPKVRTLNWLDYLFLGLNFLGMALLGAYLSRRQKSTGEYALGGNKIRWWMAGISLFATQTSAISIMAIPAMTYNSGIIWLMQAIIAFPVVLALSWIIPPLLRRLKLTSVYGYLEQRYHPGIRVLASIQSVVFLTTARMTIIMLLPSLALAAVTGWHVVSCVLIIGVVATIYTGLGGIDAVVWNDVVQVILVIGGPILILILSIGELRGGLGQFVHIAMHYDKFRPAIWSWNWSMPVFWLFVFTALMQFFVTSADQSQVQRILCTPDAKAARSASIIAAVIGFLGALIFFFMGITLFAYFHCYPQKLDPTMRTDEVVPLFIVQTLPMGVRGLLIAGIFSAAMSAISGAMSSVGTLVAEDFFPRLFPHASDRARLRIMRISTYLSGIIAILITVIFAMSKIPMIFTFWSKLYALIGGGFAGIFFLGMFTRRANSVGVLIGALASIAVTAYLMFCTDAHWLLYMPASILICITVGYITSIFLPESKRDLTGLTVFVSPKPDIEILAQ